MKNVDVLLPCSKEMGMGNDRYHLIDTDHGDAEIKAADAVKGISGKWVSDGQ